MTKRGLPLDSTVESVIPLLSNADDYVRQVFANAHHFSRDNAPKPVRIRIGITGNGTYPNYRFEALDAAGQVMGDPTTFRGDNHKPLFQDNFGLAEIRWSSETMSFAEVRDLLGLIRNFRP